MVESDNTNTVDANHKGPALWGWHTYVSIALMLTVLVCLVTMLDVEEVWRHIAAMDKTFLLLGGLAHYAIYPVRGLRWRRCLMHLSPTGSVAKFGLLVFFYYAVENVVPAKLGDVYGAHLARINCGVSRSAAMGSIVFTRMVDAWVVLLLASLSSWWLFSVHMASSVLWSLIGGVVIAVGITSIVLGLFLCRNASPTWFPKKAQHIIQAFRTGMLPKPVEALPIAVLTAVIWALEICWVACLALAFGLELSLAEAVFITMVPLPASAFPLTPAGAGVVELTLFSCLRVVGASNPVAASLTIVHRVIDYWLHIGFGVVTWAVRHAIGLRTWREVPLEDINVEGSIA